MRAGCEEGPDGVGGDFFFDGNGAVDFQDGFALAIVEVFDVDVRLSISRFRSLFGGCG